MRGERREEGGGRRREEGEREGERSRESFFFSSFSMTFHGVPLFRSQETWQPSSNLAVATGGTRGEYTKPKKLGAWHKLGTNLAVIKCHASGISQHDDLRLLNNNSTR